MLRPLLTYLLLINLFTISLLNVREEMPVYQSLVSAKELVKRECVSIKKEGTSVCSGFEIDQTASHTSKSGNAEMLETLPAEYENEIEIESHVFGTPVITHLNYRYLHPGIQTYHMYEFSIIKLHHLDIFSPPPNC